MEDDNIESLRKPVGITKPKCRLMLICQPTNNHITEYTGIALKRNVPPFMRTASKPKHVRKRKRRCYFQNCTNTSDNCEIINHGCSLYRNEVRIRNNTLRRNNFAKHKALKNANQDFATDNYLKNVNYMKTVSFLDDYVTPATVEKGKLKFIWECPFLNVVVHQCINYCQFSPFSNFFPTFRFVFFRNKGQRHLHCISALDIVGQNLSP